MKAAAKDSGKWPEALHSALWAEWVTINCRLGTSPYYVAHGVKPIFPFNVEQATYITKPLAPIMTTTDLITACASALQKQTEDLRRVSERVHSACMQALKEWLKKHQNIVTDFNFMPGALVIVRDIARDSGLKAQAAD